MGIKSKEEFPVGECIKDCYLKKIEYKRGIKQETDEEWEALVFSIVHRESWINIFIADVNKEKYMDLNELKRKKYNIEVAIERMLSLYLDKNEMQEYLEGLAGIERNFKSYCQYIISIIESKDFKNISLDLKTSPRKGGGAIVYPIGVFIKRSDDDTKVLQYTEWEEERISNFHKL